MGHTKNQITQKLIGINCGKTDEHTQPHEMWESENNWKSHVDTHTHMRSCTLYTSPPYPRTHPRSSFFVENLFALNVCAFVASPFKYAACTNLPSKRNLNRCLWVGVCEFECEMILIIVYIDSSFPTQTHTHSALSIRYSKPKIKWLPFGIKL